jgi:3-deoxy-D-manno-octulosonic-acid transferase
MNAFAGAMKMAALFSHKIKLGVEGREGLTEKLKAVLPELIGNRPVVWFHAASLGEFEQGRPVMEEFRKEFPDYFILLTFFSPSGYEIRKNYAGADYVSYMPLDTARNAKGLNPTVVFTEKCWVILIMYLFKIRNH